MMERIIDTSHKIGGRLRNECPSGYEEYNIDWFLTPDGDMFNAWSDYEIESDRIDEDDWVLHCMRKRWFDANTFLPAYFEACRRAGIEKIEIRIRN